MHHISLVCHNNFFGSDMSFFLLRITYIYIMYVVCVYRFGNLGWPMMFCQELGYPGSDISFYAIENDPNYTSSYPNTLENPTCRSPHTKTMADCPSGNLACDYTHDVYVQCSKTIFWLPKNMLPFPNSA